MLFLRYKVRNNRLLLSVAFTYDFSNHLEGSPHRMCVTSQLNPVQATLDAERIHIRPSLKKCLFGVTIPVLFRSPAGKDFSGFPEIYQNYILMIPIE